MSTSDERVKIMNDLYPSSQQSDSPPSNQTKKYSDKIIDLTPKAPIAVVDPKVNTTKLDEILPTTSPDQTVSEQTHNDQQLLEQTQHPQYTPLNSKPNVSPKMNLSLMEDSHLSTTDVSQRKWFISILTALIAIVLFHPRILQSINSFLTSFLSTRATIFSSSDVLTYWYYVVAFAIIVIVLRVLLRTI
jgi:hypothetical protein